MAKLFPSSRNFLDTVILLVKFAIKYIFYFRVNPQKLRVSNESILKDKVSVVLPTYGDYPLFEKCIISMLENAGYDNVEFIIWDNNSSPNTKRFINRITDKRVRVVKSVINTGLNAYHLGFKQASGKYFVCVDHDVIKFPKDWLVRLISTYERLEDVKFLATDVVSDEYTDGAKYPNWMYQSVEKDGVSLQFGSVGGWCAVTDRDTYFKLGGFPYFPTRTYFFHDKYYIRNILLNGGKVAIDKSVCVYHARDLLNRLEDSQVANFVKYLETLSL